MGKYLKWKQIIIVYKGYFIMIRWSNGRLKITGFEERSK